MRAVVVMALVAGGLSIVAAPSSVRLSHVALSDFPGDFFPYTPAELYGGGSPAETCFTCLGQNVQGGASGAASIDPNADVNAATGDFSTTAKLFDVSGIGGGLNMSLTYDAQYAQQEKATSQSYVGPYGYGWSSDFSTNVSNSSGTVTVDEENGAQIVFAPTQGDGCPVGDYQSLQKYTVVGSAVAYCGPNRLNAQMGEFPTYGSFELAQSGGKQVTVYDAYGQEASAGTNVNSGFFGFSYGVTPAAGTSCPVSGESTCIVENDTGGAGGGTAGPTVRTLTEEVNSAGYVSAVVDPAGNTYTFSYGSPTTLDLWNISGPLANGSTGYVWQFGYNSTNAAPYDHEMSGAENADADTTGITYSSLGQVASETDPAGYATSYSYLKNCGACVASGDDQMTTVTYPNSGSRVGNVDLDHYFEGLLVSSSFGSPSLTSVDYLTWTYNYNFPTKTDQNAPTTETIVHPGAAQSTTKSVLTFDAVGNIETSTDVNGNTTTSMYNDTAGNNLSELCWTANPGVATPVTSSCADPPSGTTTYTYDSDGHQTSRTDPLGNTTRSGYYASTGFLCWTAPPTVTATGGACSGSGIVTSASSAPSLPSGAPDGATFYAYDEFGNTVFTDVAAGTSASALTTSWFNAPTSTLNELAWSIPPEGQGSALASTSPYATNDAYNAVGFMTSSTGPESQYADLTYDALGNILSEQDPSGATSTAYDADGRACWTYRSATAVNSPACGSAPSYTSSNGPQITTYVPGTNAPYQATNQNDHTTTYYYSDPAYPTTATEVADPLGQQIQYMALDNYGNVCSSGPNLPAYNTSAQCNWISGDTQKVYDAAGNLLSSTDPTDNTTTYQYADTAYDDLVTTSTDPLARATTNSYDADGRLVHTAEPNGDGVWTGYDADSRICWRSPTASSASCGSPPTGQGVTTYAYDAASNPTSMQDNNGATGAPPATTYSYTNGLLTSVSDDNSKTVGYLYGYGGEVECIAYPVASGSSCGTLTSPATASSTNSIVDRHYDSSLRLTGTTDWLGNTVGYAYGDAASPSAVTEVTYPSATGETLSYTYDPATELTGATYAGPVGVQGGSSDSWTYSADSEQATTAQPGFTSSGSNTYNADTQVTGATNPTTALSGADTYAYQPNGEITSDTPPGSGATPTSYGYDSASELTWSAQTATSDTGPTPPSGATATTYSYDANGNRTGSSGTSSATNYGWDSYGHMCWSSTASASGSCGAPPSGVTSYAYSGNDLRSSATTGASTKDFTWDTVTGGSTPLDIADGTNAYIYGPLLFGGTAPMEQISLGASPKASFLASTKSGVQAVFEQPQGSQTSATSAADKFTYGSVSAVGSLASANGYGKDTLSVHPHTVGNALVLGAGIFPGSGPTISSVSGGGATWQKLTNTVDNTAGSDTELWLGTVTTTGSSTITVTYTGSVSSTYIDLGAQEYTNGTGASTTWSKDVVGNSHNDTSSTTVTYPSLTPSSSGEAYVGFGYIQNTLASGTPTPGFTYESTTLGNSFIYDTNVSSAVSPTATQSPAGESDTIGALLKASVPVSGISAVGSLASANGYGKSTLSVDPQNVGDALVLGAGIFPGSGPTISSISGGGASWQRLTSTVDNTAGSDTELWLGTVTTTGSSTITVTYSGSVSSTYIDLNAQEYTNGTGASTTWSKDVAGNSHNDTSSTTVTYPSLTPSSSGEAYVGFGYIQNTLASGTPTPGFTYDASTLGNSYIYDTNVSAAVSPTATQSPAGQSDTIGALLKASVPAPSGISAVGSLASTNGWSVSTLSVDPQNVGDALVLGAGIFPGSGPTISSISGGGATWQKLTNTVDNTAGSDTELWLGTVTTTGSSTITVTYSGSVSSTYIDLNAQEYTNGTGSATTWSKDVVGNSHNDTSSTTVTYPSLTPSSSGEAYVGFGYIQNTLASGTPTPGFTYDASSLGNSYIYDTNVSAAVAPTATQSPAGESDTIGALFKASVPVLAGPVVTAVTPSEGTVDGGTSVSIAGSGFTGATAVHFGTTAASSYTVNSASSVTAVAPAGTASTVDVTVTAPANGLLEQAAYSTYGEQTIQAGSDVTPFGFQGSYTDPSGLLYLIDRYYDPSTDQFLSVDPDVAETGQPYAYTGDDPLNATDPLGLRIIEPEGDGSVSELEIFYDDLLANERASQARAAAAAAADRRYVAAATAAMCGCSGNPATILAHAIGSSVVHHPLQTAALGITAIGTVPLDETGVGEAADAAEASAFASEDAGEAVSYDSQLQEAQDAYPNKAGSTELHHIYPKYLGGDPAGETVPIDGAYHQMITNAFRSLAPYGQGPVSDEAASQIMNEVYGMWPLP